MTEVVVFPDGEAFLVSYLRPLLSPVRVGTVVPNGHTSSDRFVRVSRTGGGSVDLFTDGGTYLIEVYGATGAEAAAFAATVRAYVLACARRSDLVRKTVDGGGLAYIPDPVSGQPKYQCLVQLNMRGQALSL